MSAVLSAAMSWRGEDVPASPCVNVTYDHRVDNPDEYNYCVVPGSGQDAILFACAALVAAVALASRLSALWVLLAGAAAEALSWRFNLGRFSNAIALWLGMEPAEIFFYLFLPPLLLDSAVRVDYYVFRKVMFLALIFAFVLVIASTFFSIPLLMHALGLAEEGWSWVHCALFSAMVASTDAVAVSAGLKAGGAPELLSALLEGESLFNDASGLVLFDIFMRLLLQQTQHDNSHKHSAPTTSTHMSSLPDEDQHLLHTEGFNTSAATSGRASSLLHILPRHLSLGSHHPPPSPPPPSPPGHDSGGRTVMEEVLGVSREFAWLSGGGVLVGLIFGFATSCVMRWLQKRRQPPYIEVTVTLAAAYLSFYVANSYLKASGVIAVVVFGLYGAASMKWDMSIKAKREGSMPRFWDVTSFTMNSIIFFYVGASSTNFLIRLSEDLGSEGQGWWGLARDVAVILPAIYLSFSLLRGVLIGLAVAVSRVVPWCRDVYIPWQGVVFATVGGMRGAVSLVLAQTVLTLMSGRLDDGSRGEAVERKVIAQMGLFTAGFVMLTLVINAPLVEPLMGWLGLNTVSTVKQQMRTRARTALTRYTAGAISELQSGAGDALRGVDWAAVARYVDLGRALDKVLPQHQKNSYIWQQQQQQQQQGGREGDSKKQLSQAGQSTRAPSFASSVKEELMDGDANGRVPSVLLSKPSHQGLARTGSTENGGEGRELRSPAKAAAAGADVVQDVNKAAHPSLLRVSSRKGHLAGTDDLSQPLLSRAEQEGAEPPGPLELTSKGWHGVLISALKRTPAASTTGGLDYDALEQQYEALMKQERDNACYFTRARDRAAGNRAAPSASVVVPIPPPADENHVWPEGLMGRGVGVSRSPNSSLASEVESDVGEYQGEDVMQVPDDEELADFVAQLEAHQGHHHRGHHKRSSAGGSSGGADQGSDREGGELSPVREGASTSAAAAAATSTEAAGGGGTDARGEGAEEEEGGPREGMSSLHDGAGGAPGKAPRASSMRAVLKSPTSLYVDPDYIQDSEDRHDGEEALVTSQLPGQPTGTAGSSAAGGTRAGTMPPVPGRVDNKPEEASPAAPPPPAPAGPTPKLQRTPTFKTLSIAVHGILPPQPLPPNQSSAGGGQTGRLQRVPSSARQRVSAAEVQDGDLQPSQAGRERASGDGGQSRGQPMAATSGTPFADAKGPSQQPTQQGTPQVPASSGMPSAGVQQVQVPKRGLALPASSLLGAESALPQISPVLALDTDHMMAGGSSAVPGPASGVLARTPSLQREQVVVQKGSVGDSWYSAASRPPHHHALSTSILPDPGHRPPAWPLPSTAGDEHASEETRAMMFGSAHRAMRTAVNTAAAAAAMRRRASLHLTAGGSPRASSERHSFGGTVSDEEKPQPGTARRATIAAVPVTKGTLQHASSQPFPHTLDTAGSGHLPPRHSQSMPKGVTRTSSGVTKARTGSPSTPPASRAMAVLGHSTALQSPRVQLGLSAFKSFRAKDLGEYQQQVDQGARGAGGARPQNSRSRTKSGGGPRGSGSLARASAGSRASSTGHMSVASAPASRLGGPRVGAPDDGQAQFERPSLMHGALPEGREEDEGEASEVDVDDVDDDGDEEEGDWDEEDEGEEWDPEAAAEAAELEAARAEALRETLAELRVRLLSGLKRHFHAKHAEGLLSSRGLRSLDWCCDSALDEPDKPLDLWERVEAEVSQRGWVARQAAFHFRLRQFINRMRNIPLLDGTLVPPLYWVAQVIGSWLSSAMMAGVEVALEVHAALTSSPQAQWVAYAGPAGMILQDEMEHQTERVWRYMLDREIEAPDRFQAIQTHRAAMAVLRAQQGFVDQLHVMGMIDDHEKDGLLSPIERQMWKLETRGPKWKHPALREVLLSVPFLKDIDTPMFEWLRSSGELVAYPRGALIASDAAPCGIFIVVSGMVRITLNPGTKPASEKHTSRRSGQQPSEARQSLRSEQGHDENEEDEGDSFYVGSGGVGGLTQALMGRSVPGMSIHKGVAEGNALGKGPLVFHLRPHVLATIKARAAAGEPAFMALELSMYQLAGLFILDRQRQAAIDNIVALLMAAVAQVESAGTGIGGRASAGQQADLLGTRNSAGQHHHQPKHVSSKLRNLLVAGESRVGPSGRLGGRRSADSSGLQVEPPLVFEAPGGLDLRHTTLQPRMSLAGPGGVPGLSAAQAAIAAVEDMEEEEEEEGLKGSEQGRERESETRHRPSRQQQQQQQHSLRDRDRQGGAEAGVPGAGGGRVSMAGTVGRGRGALHLGNATLGAAANTSTPELQPLLRTATIQRALAMDDESLLGSPASPFALPSPHPGVSGRLRTPGLHSSFIEPHDEDHAMSAAGSQARPSSRHSHAQVHGHLFRAHSQLHHRRQHQQHDTHKGSRDQSSAQYHLQGLPPRPTQDGSGDPAWQPTPAAAQARLMRRCVERALSIFEALKTSVRKASLVRLAPRQTFTQRSTLLLVNGSLIQTAARGDSQSSTAQVVVPAENGPHHHGGARHANQPGHYGHPDGHVHLLHDHPGHGYHTLPVFKPPGLLIWLPDFFEWGISRYFARGGAVTFMAGPTGAMLLVCEPSEHLAPLVEEESSGAGAGAGAAGGGGARVGAHEQAHHTQQSSGLRPPMGANNAPPTPALAQPSAGQMFLKRSASTRWNV